jgi:aromatic ring-opening dioxygenase catalytic subunit (LigB family)
MRQPTYFIPHGGGPCFFMEWNPRDAWDAMAAFLRGIAATLPERPKAIVLVSAHWQETGFVVTAAENPGLIYDYYGFPPHTYQLQYPAPGSPTLAERLVKLLAAAGLPAGKHATRGFDHGMFIPLLLMFPAADIPVVQLSLATSMDPALHLQAGRAIAALREEGVLVVGSGMSFHNMRAYGDPRYIPVAEEFDGWLRATLEAPPADRDAALAEWVQAPSGRLSHPPRGEEHLLPLMVAAGAAGEDLGRCVYRDRVMETALSGYRFG